MTAISSQLDAFEADSLNVAVRRTEKTRRPPRRESPRFSSRRKGKGVMSGMYQRGRKQYGC